MSLSLYAKTLIYPSNFSDVTTGTFYPDGPRQILVVRGSLIELYDFAEEDDEFTLRSVACHDCFAIVRRIQAFRIAGTNKDRILITSDSGNLSVVEYIYKANRFQVVFNEPFGKSGIRRVVPGEYLAVDPKGRAAMVASIEKNKLVYVLNRDTDANITVSSPLEAHVANHLVYNIVALDVGYENPLFVGLEVNYDEGSTKKLNYYELDLGLNHVLKKASVAVPPSSNIMIPVPGGDDGPSGVIVCTDGFVWYFDNLQQQPHLVLIPRPMETDNIPRIVCGTCHSHNDNFLILLQAESGIVYCLTFDMDGLKVNSISIKYLAVKPRATMMEVIKPGYLFLASETSGHTVEMITNLGSDHGLINSIQFNERIENTYGAPWKSSSENPNYATFEESCQTPPESWHATLDPLGQYFNKKVEREEEEQEEEEEDEALYAAAELDSLHPLLDIQVSPQQIVTASGQGIYRMQFGVGLEETGSSSLATRPQAVFTTKTKSLEEFDKYLLMSFADHTMVLELGEQIHEASSSPFRRDVRTLAVQQLGQDSLAQIHPQGIRLIAATGEANEWTPEDPSTHIISASTNAFQVAILLSTEEVVYFELDDHGSLNEYEERKIVTGATCISIGAVPEGRARSPFLAVGYAEESMKLFSLNLDTMLETLLVQTLTAAPSDILIAPLDPGSNILYLHIALRNGVLVSSRLDPLSGELSDPYTQFLGSLVDRALFPCNGGVVVAGAVGRPWIVHLNRGKLDIVPLLYQPIKAFSSFTSSNVANGMIAVCGSDLKILSSDMTYRVHSETFPFAKRVRDIVLCGPNSSPETIAFGSQNLKTTNMVCMGAEGWLKSSESFDEGHVVVSTTKAYFDGVEHLVVGVAVDQSMLPKPNFKAAYIYVYNTARGTSPTLVHRTQVDQVPLAMAAFKKVGVIVGVGSRLRLYTLGKKQLLRKAELDFDNESRISALVSDNDRIIVGDQRYSITYVVYKSSLAQFLPFATDSINRHVTAMAMVDYDTVFVGDKFGSICVLRCSEIISKLSDEDDAGIALRSQTAKDNKLELLCHYFTGDYVTTIRPTKVNGKEVVFVSGIQGSVMTFSAIASKHDNHTFNQLERAMQVRKDASLVGRDHTTYRGYYSPVKATIDGDLLSHYRDLPSSEQKQIASSMNRTTRELEKKVAMMRVM